MQVNVLIPVHNRIDATMACLACLGKQTYKNIKIVIVDDGSTDGTYEKIKEKYKEVDILRGDGDLWWTGAMHMGVEHIQQYSKEGDFLLSMNNDIVFDPDLIDSLVKTSKAYRRAIVGSMERDYYNRDVILYSGEWLDWRTFKFNVQKGPVDKDAICNEHVNVLPGRGLLIPVEVFKKIGNFNKDKFPHYIADYDFTLRAFNAGIRLVLSYKSLIYSRSDFTGISIKENRHLSLREVFINFGSIRSDQNLMDHINFIRVNCPGQYRKRHIIRLILMAIFRLRVTAPLRNILRKL